MNKLRSKLNSLMDNAYHYTSWDGDTHNLDFEDVTRWAVDSVIDGTLNALMDELDEELYE